MEDSRIEDIEDALTVHDVHWALKMMKRGHIVKSISVFKIKKDGLLWKKDGDFGCDPGWRLWHPTHSDPELWVSGVVEIGNAARFHIVNKKNKDGRRKAKKNQ